MQSKVSETLTKAQQTIIRYPLVLLTSFIMSAFAVYLAGLSYNNERSDFFELKIIMVSALGISLLFAVKMLSQRIGKELLWSGLGLGFLIGYYFLLPKNQDDFTEMYAYLLVPTYVLSHLLVAFIAFIKKENSEMSFWQFNKNLFVNFILTIIFSGVLIGGVELAILAVDELFNADIDYKTYLKVFYFLLIFGSTFIFLLFNDSGLKLLEKDGKYPVVLKFFTQFILIPLLIIYVIILYFYSGKILINWELPQGWVSYLILVYSVVGILALLLVHPLKEETAKSWVKAFSKLFYYTLIPLLVLLYVAIFTRVLEYNFTEARYFVLLLAIWLTSLVVYFGFFKKAMIKFIPISLFALGLFALCFPYFNAFSVAKRSQKHELVKVLTESDLLKDGKIDFNQKISSKVLRELEDKFEFLDQRFQRDYLAEFFSEEMQDDLPKSRYWNLRSKFAEIEKGDENQRYSQFELRSALDSYDIEGYQYAKLLTYFGQKEIKIKEDVFVIAYDDSSSLKIELNEKDSVEFMPEIIALFEKYSDSLETYVDVDDLFVEADLENYHIKLYFDSISRTNNSSKNGSYYINNILVLIKEN